MISVKKKLYYRGTKAQFSYTWPDMPEKKGHKCILAEVWEKGYVFQVICIHGYHAGCLEGMIKKDPTVKGAIAVTKNHLIKELKRNFGKINMKTFKILDK